jgi:hypothetical protein
MFRKLILAPFLALVLMVPLAGCSKDKNETPKVKDKAPAGPKEMKPGSDKTQPKPSSE